MAAPAVSPRPSSSGPTTKRRAKSKSLWRRLTNTKKGQAAGGGGGRKAASSSLTGSGNPGPGPAASGHATPRSSGGKSAAGVGAKGCTPETAATMASLTPGSGGVELPEPLFPAFQGDEDRGAGGVGASDVSAPGLSPSRRSGHRPAQAGGEAPGPPPTSPKFCLTPTKSHAAHGSGGHQVHSASKSLASGLREQATLSTASMTATHGERSGGHGASLQGSHDAATARQLQWPNAGSASEVGTPRSSSGRVGGSNPAGTPESQRWTPLADEGWMGGRARTLPAVG